MKQQFIKKPSCDLYHLMLLPTLNCPASCHYCFGPHENGPTMTADTLAAVVHWQNQNANNRRLEISFHGGEPLLPGIDWYRIALPLLEKDLAPRKIHFSVQSNLWHLTEEMCNLFKTYQVSLGTSLDGPKSINDAQRGKGYFQRTMAGIKLARDHDLKIGCICTFTSRSVEQIEEIFDFFLTQGLDYSFHAALQALGKTNSPLTLSTEAYSGLMCDLFERYIDKIDQVRINTMDAMCRSMAIGEGTICTFSDCLGHYKAIDPEGWIYPCQRMVGLEQFRLGNVHDCPNEEDLTKAPIWVAMQARQKKINEACSNCPHIAYCRGGCSYNVLVANNGRFDGDPRDPHCAAYRKIFDLMTEHALSEVFSVQNLAALVSKKPGEHGLLRKGSLIQVMRGGPHPRDVARKARQIVAAAALGVCPTPDEAVEKLDQAGVITQPISALNSIRKLHDHLETHSQHGLVNVYLHITDACNLSCRHCYAISKNPQNASFMSVEDVISITNQAAKAGFRKLVITGGEPMMHKHQAEILHDFAEIRWKIKPMQIVLRTNLAYALTEACMDQMLSATDEIVVSIDGDRVSHDAQRGAGTYDRTLKNLRHLCNYPFTSPDQIYIAATLTEAQIKGPEGESVRKLGDELGLRTRIKPILPLGRGRKLDLKLSFQSSLMEDVDRLAYSAYPTSTCGLGMNLYIGTRGKCYPCYALIKPQYYLGNALRESLSQILRKNDVFRKITVDSNEKCHICGLRYLCGGYCRAWGDMEDPNTSFTDCSVMYQHSEQILCTALETLKIDSKSWQEAGLPLSNSVFKECINKGGT